MSQATTYPLKESRSAAFHSASVPIDAAPARSTGTRLNTALTTYAAIEFLAVACSAYFLGLFYYGIFLNSWRTDPRYILAATFIATLITFISIALRSFIAIRRQPKHVFLSRGIAAVMLAFPVFLSIMYIAKLSNEYSRGTFIVQIIGVGLTVACMRVLFYSWLRSAIASNQVEARRVALIGDSSHCSIFADRLRTSGIKAVGFFDLPMRRNLRDPQIGELIAACRSLRADDIIILANNEFMTVMLDLASSMAELPAGVHIVPVDAFNVFTSLQIAELGNLHTIQVYRVPLSRFDLFIKRAFDLIFATVGLVGHRECDRTHPPTRSCATAILAGASSEPDGVWTFLPSRG